MNNGFSTKNSIASSNGNHKKAAKTSTSPGTILALGAMSLFVVLISVWLAYSGYADIRHIFIGVAFYAVILSVSGKFIK